MKTIEYHLLEKRREIDALVKKLGKLESLVERFPDLGVVHNAQGLAYYFAESANGLADEWEFRRHGPSVVAVVFTRRYSIPINTFPTFFHIGEWNVAGTGIVQHQRWNAEMRNAGIQDWLINKIQTEVNTRYKPL